MKAVGRDGGPETTVYSHNRESMIQAEEAVCIMVCSFPIDRLHGPTAPIGQAGISVRLWISSTFGYVKGGLGPARRQSIFSRGMVPMVYQYGLRALFNIPVLIVGLLAYVVLSLMEWISPNTLWDIGQQLDRIIDLINEHLVVSISLLIVFLVLSVGLGFFRQMCRTLVAGTFPLQTQDDEGNAKIVHLGVNPPEIWYSPLFRIATWVLVAIFALVFGMLAVSIAMPFSPVTSGTLWTLSLLFIMYVRWLISAVFGWIVAEGVE